MLKRCRATARDNVLHRIDIRDRLILIHGPDRISHGGGKAQRIDRCSYDQRVGHQVLHLAIAEVHLHLRLGDKVVLPHIFDQADDGEPRNV
jgi:hypothetical protein